MTKELDEQLCRDFPIIFKDRHASMSKTCMCWGLDVGDGWYDIIREICEGLERIRYEYGIVTYATQVKEKFGTLRFYTDHEPRLLKLTKDDYDKAYMEEMDLIVQGENKSAVTCEACGKPAKLQGTGWKTTLCDSCFEKYKKGERFV